MNCISETLKCEKKCLWVEEMDSDDDAGGGGDWAVDQWVKGKSTNLE